MITELRTNYSTMAIQINTRDILLNHLTNISLRKEKTYETLKPINNRKYSLMIKRTNSCLWSPTRNG